MARACDVLHRWLLKGVNPGASKVVLTCGEKGTGHKERAPSLRGRGLWAVVYSSLFTIYGSNNSKMNRQTETRMWCILTHHF